MQSPSKIIYLNLTYYYSSYNSFYSKNILIRKVYLKNVSQTERFSFLIDCFVLIKIVLLSN